MAVIPMKFAITKSTFWRGATEEFTNVYVIDGADNNATSQLEGICDAAVSAEKTIHSSDVLFVRAQVYSFGDFGPNFMYFSKNLSGSGTFSGGASMFKECTTHLRARLPRDFSITKSVQPYLRKFYHTMLGHGQDVTGSGNDSWGTPPASLNTMIAFLNNPGSGLTLESESGASAVGAWQRHNFAPTRQFRRGRKEY